MTASMLGDAASTTTPWRLTSSGRRGTAFWIRFWTKTERSSTSLPISKVTLIFDWPSPELTESMYIMPGTPLISCSSRAVTVSSTTSALAPG